MSAQHFLHQLQCQIADIIDSPYVGAKGAEEGEESHEAEEAREEYEEEGEGQQP